MDPRPPVAPAVLRLKAARLPIEPGGAPSRPIDLRIRGGELALVHPGDASRAAEFADACVGLAPPAAGRVSFLGTDWARLGAEAAATLRGRVGRLVGAAGAWIPGLSVAENVLLPQLHHTERPLAELRQEAARLAIRFGLPGLPAGSSADAAPADLQRAGLVRAFLGRPRLVILERAAEGVWPEIVEPLVNAIRGARERGAAVLWLTLDPAVWTDPSLPAGARYRLTGDGLAAAGGRAA
jgi:phospholipid/cholesterol/gamma-HCH transport system ATP-binding protein